MGKSLITEYQKAQTVLENEQELLNEEVESTEEKVDESKSTTKTLIDEILRK